MKPVFTFVLLAFVLSGCIGFVSGPNTGYYRGGGIGLFVVILAAGLLFGKRRR